MKKIITRVLAPVFTLLLPVRSYAQIKITSLSEIEGKAKEGADTIINIAKYAIGAVLFLALIFVIYAIATNKQNAREYAIGWVIALVVYLIGISIL
jgi:hypothetical protein